MSSAVRCGSEQRRRYLPSRFSSALILALSMRSSPPGVTRRNRFRPGLRGQGSLDSRPRSAAVSAVGAVDELLELRDEAGADGGVAFCLVRVEADDEPVAVVAEADFLDLQVVPDGLVAALPGQGGLHLGGAGAELLPDDVPAAALHQGAAVLLGGEAAVGDPDDLRQRPLAAGPVLTCRIRPESAVFPGQDQTRTGIPSRVTAIPTMTCGRSSRESLDLPWARNPAPAPPRPRCRPGRARRARRAERPHRPLPSRNTWRSCPS